MQYTISKTFPVLCDLGHSADHNIASVGVSESGCGLSLPEPPSEEVFKIFEDKENKPNCCAVCIVIRGPDSSVRIATELRTGGPVSSPGGDEIFCPVAHPAYCTTGTGFFLGIEAAGAWG